jgi:hypothetical protein
MLPTSFRIFKHCSFFLLLVALPLSISFASFSQGELAPTPHSIAQPLLGSPSNLEPQTASKIPLIHASSDPLAPYTILLGEKSEQPPKPAWVRYPAVINKKDSALEIPLPSLSEPTEIENFALTVLFEDIGDGGPLVEWKEANGERIMLSSGLGMNGSPIGLNSRTIQVPYECALDGGTLIVSHAGRFERIVSVTVRPGRSLMIAALGGKISPAIVDESLTVLEKEAADGHAFLSLKKEDVLDRSIVTAVLSPHVEQFSQDETLEFHFELGALPQATVFRTDLQGLDLESHIEVELNGTPIGTLHTPYFQLDAPEFISRSTQPDGTALFELAGWQQAHLFIPASLWKKGEDNALVLILKQGEHAAPSKTHLKNSVLELRYPTTKK